MCPYCLNGNIVNPKADAKFVPVEEVLHQLDEWGEDRVLISGGEPCQEHSEASISEMVQFFVSHNKQVGISTNGTYPKELSMLTINKLVSFVALDCKFSPLISDRLGGIRQKIFNASILGGSIDPVAFIHKLRGSLEILNQWHESDPEAQSEVRTTLYPSIIYKPDIEEIATLVHPRSSFVLQQYRRNINFAGIENPIDPYNADKVEELLAVAKSKCKARVSMRWP
jgi:organic radical activating enzyme